MELEIRRKLHSVAAAQYGLVHREQIEALGISAKQLFRLTQRVAWEWATPTVLRARAAGRSVEQRLKLAQLDAGLDAVLSHATAAAKCGAPGYRVAEPFHLLLARFDKPRNDHLGIVHRSRVLPLHHVQMLDGWAVTTPARTLFDLAATEHPMRVERTLDALWAQQLVSYDSLRQTLDEIAERGRKGIALLRRLIEARSDGYRPPESSLERRLEQLLVDAGLPQPERQVEIFDDEGFVARVDYCYRDLRVVIFVDSDRFHSAKTDRDHDFAQTMRLHRAGYLVLRIVEHDLRIEPMRVVLAVRAALSRRTGVS